MPGDRRIVRSTQFKKDFKLAQRRDGRVEADLRTVLELLVEGEQLPERYRDHLLVGYRPPVRECHVHPDVLLIYRLTDERLELVRLGSHSDLF